MNIKALLYADPNLVDPSYYEMAIANNTFGKNPTEFRSQGVCQG